MANEIIGAKNGSFIVNDTIEKTVEHNGIYVLEDTVFTSIKINGADEKADYVSTPATAVKAGALIRPSFGLTFSGVQLASGSVALIL